MIVEEINSQSDALWFIVEKNQELDGLSDDERKSMFRLMDSSIKKWVSDVDREKFKNAKSLSEAQRTCKINWVMAMEEIHQIYLVCWVT